MEKIMMKKKKRINIIIKLIIKILKKIITRIINQIIIIKIKQGLKKKNNIILNLIDDNKSNISTRKKLISKEKDTYDSNIKFENDKINIINNENNINFLITKFDDLHFNYNGNYKKFIDNDLENLKSDRINFKLQKRKKKFI